MPGRFNHTLSAVSQLANVMLFGGHPNESISARCFLEGQRDGHQPWKTFAGIIDLVFSPVDRNHCYQSHLTDVAYSESLLKSIAPNSYTQDQ